MIEDDIDPGQIYGLLAMFGRQVRILDRLYEIGDRYDRESCISEMSIITTSFDLWLNVLEKRPDLDKILNELIITISTSKIGQEYNELGWETIGKLYHRRKKNCLPNKKLPVCLNNP